MAQSPKIYGIINIQNHIFYYRERKFIERCTNWQNVILMPKKGATKCQFLAVVAVCNLCAYYCILQPIFCVSHYKNFWPHLRVFGNKGTRCFWTSKVPLQIPTEYRRMPSYLHEQTHAYNGIKNVPGNSSHAVIYDAIMCIQAPNFY